MKKFLWIFSVMTLYSVQFCCQELREQEDPEYFLSPTS